MAKIFRMKSTFRITGKYNLKMLAFFTIILPLIAGMACNSSTNDTKPVSAPAKDTAVIFSPPDTSTIPHNEFGEMVRYGRELVVNTAYYIGPKGTVGKYLGNKMNCANCHVDAGTRPFAFNYFSAHARYPQYRGRENQVLTLAQRVNNCIERPHSGTPMPLDSKEMVAIVSYIKSNSAIDGSGLMPDDWIKEIDGNAVDSFAEVVKKLTAIENDLKRKEFVLLVSRGTETAVLRVKLH